MKQLYYYIVVFTTLITTTLNSQTYKADVGVVVQEQNQWCWCANCKCILDYYGIVKNQCDITEYCRTKLPSTFGSKNCCTNGTSCNKPNNMVGSGTMQDALQYFGKIQTEDILSGLTVAQIKAALIEGRPFSIGVKWSSGGGHVVVGCAYTGTSLTYMDPWQSNGMTTQAFTGGTAMKTNSGSGTWAETLLVTTKHSGAGINDISAIASAINLYPNPSDGKLTLNSELTIKAVNIFSATGQLVKTYAAAADKSLLLELPVAGFYNVQVVTENAVVNKKVIVQ